MDHEDYERRKRALEEIYKTDLELVRAAHEARLRSLEALWLSGSPGPAAETAAARPAPAPQAAPVPRPRNPDLRTALEAIFPELPDAFEKKDIIAALGWTPSRGSLYRVLTDMAIERRLKIQPSLGRHPSRYRKV